MNKLHIWIIYYNPSDYPNLYVARRFECDKPTDDVYSHPELIAIRDLVRTDSLEISGIVPVRLERHVLDDKNIVEIWI